MGLFRTAARASVAARVVGNTQRRQQKRWEAEDAAQAATVQSAAPVTNPEPVTESASAGSSMEARIEQLEQLGRLRDSGVLTAEEFETQKQQVLTS